MITIKGIAVLIALMGVPTMDSLMDVVEWVYEEHDQNLVITSGFRKGDPGVHGQIPLRGLDIRSRVYSDPDRPCRLINDRWEYDWKRPEKKVASLHGEGDEIHIHLKVHPRTRLR
ncbi:hypothetical protein LCGC14_1705280 [marine sediment metagenome]|uniref:Peptidase M15A C-terminal domain-containing protein n=1 Tax=marine sediment metagenome TaxID=412755 RepID=A0A0F9HGH6_9ZZZZ